MTKNSDNRGPDNRGSNVPIMINDVREIYSIL